MLPVSEFDALLTLCAEAAAKVLAEYHGQAAAVFTSKGDDSPLTRADLASHEHLLAGLARLTPDIPVLSEESEPAMFRDRLGWRRLWLVDPLDGTREFLARSGEFTINLALIEDGVPRLGLLFDPLAGTACLGAAGVGAWQCHREDRCWQRQPLTLRGRRSGEPVRVLSSRRHRGSQLERTLALIAAQAGGFERCNRGSALKFAMLARGEADCYPRFAPCSEWDVAAGHALLSAVGGEVLSLSGRPLRYNQRDSLLSPNFLAVADQADPMWAELLMRLGESPGQAPA